VHACISVQFCAFLCMSVHFCACLRICAFLCISVYLCVFLCVSGNIIMCKQQQRYRSKKSFYERFYRRQSTRLLSVTVCKCLTLLR
jgi:hypothetical protein